MDTERTYRFIFDRNEWPNGPIENDVVNMRGFNLEDAQDKVLIRLESLGVRHGTIKSAKKLQVSSNNPC